jgi:hypothetical protein
VSALQAEGVAPALQFVWQAQFDQLLTGFQRDPEVQLAEASPPPESPFPLWAGEEPFEEDVVWEGKMPNWLELPRAWNLQED